MTTETWLGSVYSIHSQAELTVDHGHEISMFQHDLQYIVSLHLLNTLQTVLKLIQNSLVSRLYACHVCHPDSIKKLQKDIKEIQKNI